MAKSDDSFNATGPTIVAFETSSTDVPVNQGFGVSVVGSICGVYGQGTSDAQLDRRTAPEGTGVLGRGQAHGVYGISDTIGRFETPDFHDEGIMAIAVIGVNGQPSEGKRRQDAPAVLGFNNVAADAGTDTNSVARRARDEGARLPAGVEGISWYGHGMLGISLCLNPDKFAPSAPSADAALSETVARSDPPAGVLGLSVQGAGVRAVSRLDRGGVFESAAARLYPGGGPGPGDKTLPVRAQIRLIPHDSVPMAGPMPALPATGQAGDLLCITMPDTNHIERAALWFCEKGSSATTGPAQWKPVTLGTMVVGTGP